MKKHVQFLKVGLICLISGLIFSCKKNEMISEKAVFESQKSKIEVAKLNATISSFYALSNNNEIIKYEILNQITEKSIKPIIGLASGEKVLAIDFRPATGQLYGVTNQSRILFINLSSGAATIVGTTPFSPAIVGAEVGFDFNPTVDRIRLVTSSGQNLRLNPETGAVVAIDGNISVAGSRVAAVAYTNSFAGASSTTLYDIDLDNDKLFLQNPPNAGTLVEVGSLGIQAVNEAGFDISADNSLALAAIYGRGLGDDGQKEMSNGNKYRFYQIDLTTGTATNIGKTDREIIGLAILTNMVTYAVDNANNLIIMNPIAGTSITKAITGLDAGATVEGIDMRPATGQLYALTSNSRLYSINMSSGAATAIGTGFTPVLSGTSFGFDFNPTVDRIRIVSNTGQNLRAHPTTGLIAVVDGSLNPGTPMADGVAYNNSFAGSTATILYDIDAETDMLYQQSPPNNGTLSMGKTLGINVETAGGFDIGGASNKAWGIFKVGGSNSLYSVDLASGAANRLMPISGNIKGFAIGLGF